MRFLESKGRDILLKFDGAKDEENDRGSIPKHNKPVEISSK